MNPTALLAIILDTNVQSLRLVVSAITSRQVHEMAQHLRGASYHMSKADFVKYDVENKLQELSYLATF